MEKNTHLNCTIKI